MKWVPTLRISFNKTTVLDQQMECRIKITVFWNVMPKRQEHLGATCCFHLVGREADEGSKFL
jgi:hypothetical protein